MTMLANLPPLPCELLQITDTNLSNLVDEVSEEFLPIEEVDTLDWMERSLYLPKEESDKHGLYDRDQVPYFWGIAHALDKPSVELVAVEKAAQIGWTLLLCGWLFKVIRLTPSRILALFSKDGQVTKFFEEKFNPIGEACEALSGLIDFSSSRKAGNRASEKKFPGGFIRGVGSNSPGNVKSTAAPVVVVEEPDDTNKNVGDQGDSIRLARERIKRWKKKKFVMGGTPSVAGVSIIEHHVELGSQRVLPISCHECGTKHVLDWENVKWDIAESGIDHPVYGLHLPETAVYCCPNCGSVWDDWRRKRNIFDTCFSASQSGDEWCGWEATVDCSPKIESFRYLSELYVVMDGTSLSDVVADFLEAESEAEKGDESARIVFTNSKLAKTYEYKSDAPEVDNLEKRSLCYEEMTVPDGGLVVTAGVDVQHDRLAIIIRAWGRDEESWLVYWGEIYGDTTVASDPIWSELSKIIFRVYSHEKGYKLGLGAVSIDCSDGVTSGAVYSWVRANQSRGAMAVKGSSDTDSGREIFSHQSRVIDSSKTNTKASEYGIRVFIMGTMKSKDVFSSRLKLIGNGPSRIHWYENVRADYFSQITSEVKAPHGKGKKVLVWQCKAGVRNEAFDCERLAMHAAYSLKIHNALPSFWDALEKKFMQVDLFAQQQDEPGHSSRGGVINSGVEL